MTPRITLTDVARVATLLEPLGFPGIVARCEQLLEEDPRQACKVIGEALHELAERLS